LDKQINNLEPMVSRVIRIYDVIDAARDFTSFGKDTRKHEYYHFVNVLSYKKVKLEESLDLLKKATAETFDESISRVEEILLEISQFIKQFRQRFK
jgi:hypothetical protein